MRLINGKATALLPITLMLVGCSDQSSSSHWGGKTYLLNIPANHWTIPSRDVGGEIAPFVPQFLISLSGSGANLTATVATASNGVQNTCNATQQATFSESQYPESQFVLSEFPMTFQELNDTVTPNQPITVHSTIHDMTFTNVLPGDAPTTDGKFTVTADISELYLLFIRIQPQPPTADNVCLTLASALSWDPATCPQCAFDPSKNYCLTLGAVQVAATLTATTVEQVSVRDIAATCP